MTCNYTSHLIKGLATRLFMNKSTFERNWTGTELIHKSHDAPVPYPTMHLSEQKCAYFCVLNGALWDMAQVNSGICEIALELGRWIMMAASGSVRFYENNMGCTLCTVPFDTHMFALKSHLSRSASHFIFTASLNTFIVKPYTQAIKPRAQLGPSTIARNTALARGRRAKQPEVGTDLPWRLAAHCWLHCIFGHCQHF